MPDKSTTQLMPFADDSDDSTPLPLVVAHKWGFPLATITTNDIRFYCLRDWLVGLVDADYAKRIIRQYRLPKGLFERYANSISTSLESDSMNRTQTVEYVTDELLYRITQDIRVTKARRESTAIAAIKDYLAKAGVFVDLVRREPDKAHAIVAVWYDEKEYRKLRVEGFTHEQALECLERRANSVQTRKWITGIWHKRRASYGDFAKLTNRVSFIVHGKTATQRKKEMGLGEHDTPRNYDAATDQFLTSLAEMSAGSLHEYRNSIGYVELAEDINDAGPIVDAARPAVMAAFSKKPRRLPGEENSLLTK